MRFDKSQAATGGYSDDGAALVDSVLDFSEEAGEALVVALACVGS